MKLHQSKVLANIKRFSWTQHNHGRYWKPRDCVGYFLYWKVCEYFKPKSVLEIGFLEGLTFGLMFESTDAEFTCVDIDFEPKKHFDSLFCNDPKYQSIKFLEVDSKDLELSQSFDLVHIDGNHSFDYIKNDLEKVLPCLNKNSILIIDDMTEHCPDISTAVDQYLLGQNGFVPFLAGDREMFFHHQSHDASEFLDVFLMNNSTDIITFFNYNFKGYTVLRAHVANFFNDNEQIFFDQLRKYNL